MAEIAVRIRGVEYRFTPEQQPITIGRDPASAVVADAQAVSSTHAQLTYESGVWVYRDQSTNGSYVNDVPAREFSVNAPVTVVLGNYEQGVVIEIMPTTSAPPGTPVPTAPPTAAPSPYAPPSAGPPFGAAAPPPATPFPPGAQPPGAPFPPGVPPPTGPPPGAVPTGVGGAEKMSSVHSATQMMPKELRGTVPPAFPGQSSGQDIRIQYEGGEYVAHPGQVVNFGREPANEVQLDNPTVSRFHARLSYGPRGWQLDDLGSSRGITVDGELTRQVQLQGTTDVWFGPEEAGVRVIFAGPGKSKKKSGGVNPLAIVLPVAAVLLIAIVAIVFVARSNSTTQLASGSSVPTSADLTAMKKGTVRIEIRLKLTAEQKRRVEQEARDKGLPTNGPHLTGSGTIISPDGLVLTNAHVATPDQMNSSGDRLPPVESIKVVRNPTGGDEQLTEGEEAEVVVSDPKLDLAVLRIQGASNLPAIPIGDDASVKAGEDIYILGFPGTADTKAVTVTAGRVSSFIPDKQLGVDRAWINTDAKVEGGNSGGLAANKAGQIIGVPTGTCFESVGGGSSSGGPIASQNRVRTIDLAADLIAAAKSGADYEVKNPDEDICATGKSPRTR